MDTLYQVIHNVFDIDFCQLLMLIHLLFENFLEG